MKIDWPDLHKWSLGDIVCQVWPSSAEVTAMSDAQYLWPNNAGGERGKTVHPKPCEGENQIKCGINIVWDEYVS